MRGGHRRPRFWGRDEEETELNNRRKSKMDQLVDIANHDRWYRWRSAMVWTTAVSDDVAVGVTQGQRVSLFTTRDSITLTDPFALLRALADATTVAESRSQAHRTA